jgi:hypothetical protein
MSGMAFFQPQALVPTRNNRNRFGQQFFFEVTAPFTALVAQRHAAIGRALHQGRAVCFGRVRAALPLFVIRNHTILSASYRKTQVGHRLQSM